VSAETFYHDVAVAFSWAGRERQVEVRQPVETVRHNDLALGFTGRTRPQRPKWVWPSLPEWARLRLT